MCQWKVGNSAGLPKPCNGKKRPPPRRPPLAQPRTALPSASGGSPPASAKPSAPSRSPVPPHPATRYGRAPDSMYTGITRKKRCANSAGASPEGTSPQLSKIMPHPDQNAAGQPPVRASVPARISSAQLSARGTGGGQACPKRKPAVRPEIPPQTCRKPHLRTHGPPRAQSAGPWIRRRDRQLKPAPTRPAPCARKR